MRIALAWARVDDKLPPERVGSPPVVGPSVGGKPKGVVLQKNVVRFSRCWVYSPLFQAQWQLRYMYDVYVGESYDLEDPSNLQPDF